MKLLPVITGIIAISSSFTLSASAAPHSTQITPISWILQTQHNIDVDDKSVTLVGKVVKRDGGSDWWFSDATGSIRLDTGDMELPVGPTLTVRGHIDQSRFGVGYLEVEVSHWDYTQKFH